LETAIALPRVLFLLCGESESPIFFNQGNDPDLLAVWVVSLAFGAVSTPRQEQKGIRGHTEQRAGPGYRPGTQIHQGRLKSAARPGELNSLRFFQEFSHGPLVSSPKIQQAAENAFYIPIQRGLRLLKARLATAPAIYGPTPGRARRSLRAEGSSRRELPELLCAF